MGHAVAQLVEALRYKLEGRGFYSRWTFIRIVGLGGSIEPLTEMSTMAIACGVKATDA